MVGQKISHYKILEKLGEGGMGVVYKAEDTRLRRTVALKFLPTGMLGSEHRKARFLHEAQAAAQLDHENICTIHAIEEGEGKTFIVMAYVPGQTLREKIEAGIISIGEATDLAIQISKGLRAAHAKGIVHRDIKSSNIVITPDGQAKIMDFGLAKLSGQTQLTKEGAAIGTAAYMSPEQALGEELDQRTDIWSLGVVLYEMLSGKLPFSSAYEQAVVYSILHEEPASILSMRKDIPQKLEKVLRKLLEKDKNLRYQTAEEVIRDFAEFLDGSKINRGSEDKKSIVVLPFRNLSTDKDTDYFVDGLTEEINVNLTKLKEIRVIPRTIAVRYKDMKEGIKSIGRELNASVVMTGSVRKFQDNLRISVQLIDAHHETQKWAETYKGKLADIFDIQENVSRQIVDALKIEVPPTQKIVLEKRATSNPEAYDLYLRARDFLYRSTKTNIQFAIHLFEKAINLDPQYAGAHAGLGEAYATFYKNFDRKDIWVNKAIESSLRAITYDSSSAEAYVALALSYYCKTSYEDAVVAGKKAIDLDPNNYISYWILGRICRTADKDEEALDLFKKVIELNPDYYTAYIDLRMVYDRLGEKNKMNEVTETSVEVGTRHLSKHPEDARAHMLFATDLALVGRKEEAKKEADRALELEPTDAHMQYNASCFYSQIGEIQLAIESLKKALTLGYQDYEWIKRDPDLNNIRSEPDYVKLMKEN